MKKIAFTILAISTLVFFACEEKKDDKPATTTTATTSTTSTTSTTGATYYISASVNGVNKQFTNLTVYRDETEGNISLLIVANNLSSEKPSIEFNLKQPVSGWADNLSYALNMDQSSSYVKYITESGRVYTSSLINIDDQPFKINFSKIEFTKGGSVAATMNGDLAIDTDTSRVRIASGKLNLICDN